MARTIGSADPRASGRQVVDHSSAGGAVVSVKLTALKGTSGGWCPPVATETRTVALPPRGTSTQGGHAGGGAVKAGRGSDAPGRASGMQQEPQSASLSATWPSSPTHR